MISYAHEDRAIARELRDDLGRDYDVWFDDDKLKVGDSLFEQISRGLGTCDFGVVILSPSYIAKTWTTRELSGLMAVQDRTKKVLLPVWKNIDRAAVARFSPIMADMVAAIASEGVPAVAARLRSAIDAATRAVGLVMRSSNSERLAALGRDLQANADADARLRTTAGVEQVKAAFEGLLDGLESALKSAESARLKFNIKRQKGSLVAHTLARLALNVVFAPEFINDAVDSPMRVSVFQRSDEFGPFANPSDPSLLDDQTYTPWFAGDEVVWRQGDRKIYVTNQVLETALEMLHSNLEREASG
jgi:hypothetical protein